MQQVRSHAAQGPKTQALWLLFGPDVSRTANGALGCLRRTSQGTVGPSGSVGFHRVYLVALQTAKLGWPLAGWNWDDYRSLCNQSPLRGAAFSSAQTEGHDDEVVR